MNLKVSCYLNEDVSVVKIVDIPVYNSKEIDLASSFNEAMNLMGEGSYMFVGNHFNGQRMNIKDGSAFIPADQEDHVLDTALLEIDWDQFGQDLAEQSMIMEEECHRCRGGGCPQCDPGFFGVNVY